MRTWLFALLMVTFATAQDAPRGEIRIGEATLLDRQKYRNYEKATFSFEHGIRDDPGLRITRNDWDLHFGGGTFLVNTVTDDRSRIVDLGAKTLAAIDKLPALPTLEENPRGEATVVEGHVYLVHTNDSDSNHMSLFRVRRFVKGDRVEIEWVHWRHESPRKPLALDDATRARLAKLLDAARVAGRRTMHRRSALLADPEAIRFQIRTGAQGGNKSRLSLGRRVRNLPARPTARALDFRTSPGPRDNPSWYWKGGFVPGDKALVVDAIDVFAQAPGDNNGGGKVIVKLGNERIFEIEKSAGPFRVWFEGRAVILPGGEQDLFVDVANSSAADVRVVGHFVPLADADSVKTVPFVPTEAPDRIERVGEGVARTRGWLLDRPLVILQLRAGAGGGNPNTINMLGKASIYVDRVVSSPLSFKQQVKMNDDARAYFEGGRIPRGKVFRVTRVEYRGSARGDSNGHGEFILHVLDTVIVKERDTKELVHGVWNGSIDLHPGDESKVFINVANSSTADVRITGWIIDKPKAEPANK